MHPQRDGAAGRPSRADGLSEAFVCIYPGETVETLTLDLSQTLRVLRRAALKPGRTQFLIVLDTVTRLQTAQVRIQNAGGGRVLLHPQDAGTALAAALGVALERLGCLGKLGVAPAPFEVGEPIGVSRRVGR